MNKIIKLSSSVDIIKKEETSKGNKIFDFKLSVEEPDRGNDIVKVAGINFKDYNKNPVVLFNHDPSIPPIGTGENLYIENNTLYGSINFHRETALSRDLATLTEKGVLRAVSIAFIPTKMSDMDVDGNNFTVFEEIELLEFSLVAIPQNKNSLIKNSFNIEDVKTEEEKENLKIIFKNIIDENKDEKYLKDKDLPNLVNKNINEKTEVPQVEKAGKVLSKTNINKLRQAISLLSEVVKSADDIGKDENKEKKQEIIEFTEMLGDDFIKNILKNKE